MAVDEGVRSAPWEIDPSFGPAPDVLAFDDRDRLLVDHRGPNLSHLWRYVIPDHREGVPGVGDVVGDEDTGRVEIHQLERRGQYHRELEALAPSGVVLHIEHVKVLHSEGVGERSGDEETATSDGEDEVGSVPIGVDHLGETPGGVAVHGPGQNLQLLHGPKLANSDTHRSRWTPVGVDRSRRPREPDRRYGWPMVDAESAGPPMQLIRTAGRLPTREERREQGRAGRSRARRSSAAQWSRPDGVEPLAVLAAQNEHRYPDLVPLRWGRMAASPFAFFRGSAAVMAADLSTTTSSGLTVQACGDAHLQNFGLFASPERILLFDVNDFDETLPGPWEWDVKRLAASIVLAARHIGLSESTASSAVLVALGSYRERMAELAEMSQLDIWYSRVDASSILEQLDGATKRAGERIAAKARRRTTTQALSRLTAVIDGRRRFVDDPPIIEHRNDLQSIDQLRALIDEYRQTLAADRRFLFERFELVDTARKVVGVGSVGTHCHVALCSADRVDDDPLILQVKEATASVLEQYLQPSAFANAGERVVVGQRLMQAASDLFLGWTSFGDRHYYVRQLRDMKGSFDLEAARPSGLEAYVKACGWTLARAHARSGDPVAISAYLGRGDSFDRASVLFAHSYADQAERDHAVLRAAIDQGRIEAEEGR